MVKKKSAKVDFTKYKTDIDKTFPNNLWLSFVANILLKILLLALLLPFFTTVMVYKGTFIDHATVHCHLYYLKGIGIEGKSIRKVLMFKLFSLK